ncbi:MAG TPA: hypothetical protein VHI11_01040 [Jiangellaceae bacterium]|jgi:hypothetical protein|nr:hypothetical protein [Jiangellaceae bacterium]
MFVQVIKGQVSDPAEVQAAWNRWLDQTSSGAIGWLGTTAGVTDDGTLVALARFESEDAARRNSERPEQDQWWRETAKLFTGDVTFTDCTEVVQMGTGGSDDAGFVQVIEGRIRDMDRWRQLGEQWESMGDDFRSDVIGGIVALHGDGGYTNAIYFTTEAEAREGEQKEMPPELKAMWEEEMSLHEGEPTYYDLRHPWLASPR